MATILYERKRTNVYISLFLRGYIGSADDDKSDVVVSKIATIKIKIYHQRKAGERVSNFPLRLYCCAPLRVGFYDRVSWCIALKIVTTKIKNAEVRARFSKVKSNTERDFLLSFSFFLFIKTVAGKLRTHEIIITVTITCSHGKADMNMYQVHLLPSSPVRYGKGAETIQYQAEFFLRNVPGNVVG